MAATCEHSRRAILYLAFELGWEKWKLAFSTGLGQRPRWRTITARDLTALTVEIAQAKKRFALDGDCPVRSCYEAGRDGFWLHRFLVQQAIDNVIVDAASIEVNRRYRRRKTDTLDAGKLVAMLIRHDLGEKVWSVLRVPSAEEEDRRHLHRQLLELTAEQTRQVNRIRSLLAAVGLSVSELGAKIVEQLPALRTWDGQPLPEGLRRRLEDELARLQFVRGQIRMLVRQRDRMIRVADAKEQTHVEKVRKLSSLRGVGPHSAWVFVMEVFGWRKFRNRRELAGCAGLTPTPYSSGEDQKEQGISKAGNRRLRTMLVEIAWCWLQWQPQSALSLWYRRRFGDNSGRHKKIGIVAMARRLLIVLWRFLDKDETPEGAVLVDWRDKLAGPAAV